MWWARRKPGKKALATSSLDLLVRWSGGGTPSWEVYVPGLRRGKVPLPGASKGVSAAPREPRGSVSGAFKLRSQQSPHGKMAKLQPLALEG